MTNDHSHLAVFIAWAGLLAGFLTPVAIVLTIIFTALNIYIALRKLRREDRLERMQAELQRPGPPQ